VPGNAAGLIGQAGAALEPKKQEEKKEPNSITIADVEEVAVGKEAVKHVEGAKVPPSALLRILTCPDHVSCPDVSPPQGGERGPLFLPRVPREGDPSRGALLR
jgi:hypothetical protein